MPRPVTASKRNAPAPVWHEVIDQRVQNTGWSAAARRRLLVRVLHATGWSAVTLLASWGVLLGAQELAAAGSQSTPRSQAQGQPIRTISVASDGHLGESWVREQLALRPDTRLLAIDLESARKRLESEPQVRTATLHKQFPDTLSVFLMERSPFARLRAAGPNNQPLELVVDREGTVFSPVLVDAAVLSRLPYLAGVRLRREADGAYRQVDGLPELARFIEQAETQAPHLVRNWRIIDIQDLPRIQIRSDDAREILIDTSDAGRQLARLDYIIDYYRTHSGGTLDRVDLTVGQQVAVRIGDDSPLRSLAQVEGNRLFRSP